MQIPKVGVSSGPPGMVYIIHHRMNELLIKQNTVYDGQATSIQERA